MIDDSGVTAGPQGDFLFYSKPGREILERVGEVAVAHSKLDHTLKVTIKSVTGRESVDVLNEHKRTGSLLLRRAIRDKCAELFGESETLVRVDDLLNRCRDLSDLRNRYVHGVWAKFLDGPEALFDGVTVLHQPTIDQLVDLTERIDSISREIHEARISGFLAEALRIRRGQIPKP